MLVQKLRIQRGWSQEQLAELSGLSVRTIQRIEAGKSASAESLKSLAAVFEVAFSNLTSEPDMNSFSAQTVSHDEALALARVRKMRGFYIHLWQYLFVIVVLGVINLTVTPAVPWVAFVAFGWGTAVLGHGLTAFGKLPFLGPDWERRQVEKILQRKL